METNEYERKTKQFIEKKLAFEKTQKEMEKRMISFFKESTEFLEFSCQGMTERDQFFSKLLSENQKLLKENKDLKTENQGYLDEKENILNQKEIIESKYYEIYTEKKNDQEKFRTEIENLNTELKKTQILMTNTVDELAQWKGKCKEENEKYAYFRKSLTNETNIKEESSIRTRMELQETIKNLEGALKEKEQKIETLEKDLKVKQHNLTQVFENMKVLKQKLKNSANDQHDRSQSFSGTSEFFQFQRSQMLDFELNYDKIKVDSSTPAKKGAFGIVEKVFYLPSKKEYAMKTITKNPDDNCVEREIEMWNKIKDLNQKPSSIPNFYGSLQNHFSPSTFNLFFDYFPKSIKNIIDELKANKCERPFPFKKLLHFTERLINGLAFLQTLKICHCDLKPDNLLLDVSLKNIYIIDLSESKEIIYDSPEQTKRVMTLAGSPKYFSPELDLAFKQGKSSEKFNPFKSDVFSLGLIILELGTLKNPENNQKEKIEEIIIEFTKIYRKSLENDKELKYLESLAELIRVSLSVDPKQRFDFIDLYYTFQMKFKPNEEEILRSQILMGEQNNK